MQGTMIVIPPDGPLKRLAVARVSESDMLTMLQTAVGGYIEAVPHLKTYRDDDRGIVPCVAFCNEDGKRPPGLPYNQRANLLWSAALSREQRGLDSPAPDHLVGTVVILFGDKEFMESL